MTKNEIMALADAYAAAEQHDYLTGEASADHARAALEAALDVAHGVLEQIQRMGYSDVGDKMMVDEAIAKLKEVRRESNQ